MKERQKITSVIEIGMLAVLLASIGYLLLLAGGNSEVFLIDDNRTQWYPIIERAFEDFWRTGRIYCYDFYQMKGMPVAEQGYYGVMNPFMLLSYTVTRFLPGGIDAITFYIGLMVVLGNLFCYLICRRFGCKQVLAFLLTATYSTMGCFWAFFYWYYVFNNYFLVPLLVYVFLRCTRKGWLSYCACGIVLAMDLWMGNVQYTFYHYMLFGVLCLTMIILRNARYLKILCTNMAVGVGLSFPMLLLLLQASGDFEQRKVFIEYPLLSFSLLIHSVIPQGILRRHGIGISFLDSYVMRRDDNLVCYMGVVGILLFAMLVRSVVRLLRWAGKAGRQQSLSGHGKAGATACLHEIGEKLRDRYERAAGWAHEKKTVAGCIAALFCFLSLMSGGAVALLLEVMPVVRNFRYYFKAVFPAVPVAVLVLAYLAGRAECGRAQGDGEESVSGGGQDAAHSEEGTSEDKRVADGGEKRAGWRFRIGAVILAAAYLCVGVVNACDTVALVRRMFDMRIEGSFEKEKEIVRSAVEAADIDGKNYRTAAFLRFPGINDECFALSRNLTRNFPTAAGVFSLAGYEIATSESRLKMFDAVYSGTDFYTKYANADTVENFYHNMLEKSETMQRQLEENGVRYLLLDKTTLADNRLAKESGVAFFQNDWRENVIEALKTLPDIRVGRVCSFNDSYDLVELAGVDSLCMDGEGQMVPLVDENMQTLSFEAEKAGEYTLSFAWDSRLKAFLTEEDGTEKPLIVEETENGNIRIPTAGAGRVTLTFYDPLCTAGFVWESVTCFTFFGLFLLLAFLGKKCYSDIHKTD